MYDFADAASSRCPRNALTIIANTAIITSLGWLSCTIAAITDAPRSVLSGGYVRRHGY